jgi:hypothetical protein
MKHQPKNDKTGSLQETSTTNTEVHPSSNHGASNPNIDSHQQKETDGYKIAVEDTMIGYTNDDSQMDMDLGEKDQRRFGTSGTGDND